MDYGGSRARTFRYGSKSLGGFLEPPPLQPLDHTTVSQLRKDLEAAHQKQLHAKGESSP